MATRRRQNWQALPGIGSRAPTRRTALRARRAQAPSTEQMIARRTRGGHNAAQSRKLLAQLRREHSASTLPAALAHHGFISTAEAERMS
jgi:hypothetical protein